MTEIGMLTCIVCDRTFEPAANDRNFKTVPYEGTLFFSSGHYGSTAFDSFEGERLEIIVCDACLITRRNRVAHLLKEPVLTTPGQTMPPLRVEWTQ